MDLLHVLQEVWQVVVSETQALLESFFPETHPVQLVAEFAHVEQALLHALQVPLLKNYPLLHDVQELASFILLQVLQEVWQEVEVVTQVVPESDLPAGHDKQVLGFPEQVAQLELHV